MLIIIIHDSFLYSVDLEYNIRYTVHCPKSNPNLRDITQNVEENEILHEIFRAIFRFPTTFRVKYRKINYLWDSEHNLQCFHTM